MVFCSNCGNKIEDGVKFCPECGTPVMQQAVGTSEPAPAAPPIAEEAVQSFVPGQQEFAGQKIPGPRDGTQPEAEQKKKAYRGEKPGNPG